jgi:hypothetical protein
MCIVLSLHHEEQRAGQSLEKLDHLAQVVAMKWTRPNFEGAPGAAAPPATTSSGSSTARLLIGLDDPTACKVVVRGQRSCGSGTNTILLANPEASGSR